MFSTIDFLKKRLRDDGALTEWEFELRKREMCDEWLNSPPPGAEENKKAEKCSSCGVKSMGERCELCEYVKTQPGLRSLAEMPFRLPSFTPEQPPSADAGIMAYNVRNLLLFVLFLTLP